VIAKEQRSKEIESLNGPDTPLQRLPEMKMRPDSKEVEVKSTKTRYFLVPLALLTTLVCSTVILRAQKSAEIDRNVDAATTKLYAGSPAAEKLSRVAKGILVFPSVKKAGLIVGGQYGEGALRVDGKTAGYYKTTAVSYGLQAGGQKFGYAMFFMTDGALEYLKKSSGWEVGVGPSFVVVDEGVARSLTTTTAKDDIYVIFFNQTGLMAGLGLQGSKISQIQPDK
jgi:lipid-binding SYLF domain-containing protein